MKAVFTKEKVALLVVIGVVLLTELSVNTLPDISDHELMIHNHRDNFVLCSFRN